MKKETTLKNMEALACRSAWNKGVLEYAFMLFDSILLNFDDKEITNHKSLHEAILNGAEDWAVFSYGGGALIYDTDIALTLCTNSELKKCKGGSLPPNKHETWLDVQARALFQAERLIMKCAEF